MLRREGDRSLSGQIPFQQPGENFWFRHVRCEAVGGGHAIRTALSRSSGEAFAKFLDFGIIYQILAAPATKCGQKPGVSVHKRINRSCRFRKEEWDGEEFAD